MTVKHLPQVYVLEKRCFAGLGFTGRGIAMGKCPADRREAKDNANSQKLS